MAAFNPNLLLAIWRSLHGRESTANIHPVPIIATGIASGRVLRAATIPAATVARGLPDRCNSR